jgi:hypothetical protein
MKDVSGRELTTAGPAVKPRIDLKGLLGLYVERQEMRRALLGLIEAIDALTDTVERDLPQVKLTLD